MFFLAKAFQNLGLRGVHSAQKVFQYDKMKIKILPALSDNYMYLVRMWHERIYVSSTS